MAVSGQAGDHQQCALSVGDAVSSFGDRSVQPVSERARTPPRFIGQRTWTSRSLHPYFDWESAGWSSMPVFAPTRYDTDFRSSKLISTTNGLFKREPGIVGTNASCDKVFAHVKD
jgi:hypothetical protein